MSNALLMRNALLMSNVVISLLRLIRQIFQGFLLRKWLPFFIRLSMRIGLDYKGSII